MKGAAYHQGVGRYRWRTKLRQALPWALVGLVPKGRDCGDHEWHRVDDKTWGCVHCRVTTSESPWNPLEEAEIRLAGLAMRLELAAARQPTPELIDAQRELVVEIGDALASAERAAQMEPVS